jgi:uncharacterized protein YutE (UPF0331/DUF86 family)
MKKNKHTGSDFDDFLKEEGIFEECTAEAIKRVIAFRGHFHNSDICDSRSSAQAL